MGTSHESQSTFLIISRSVLLRMRNISDKRYREIQNTHFTFNNVSSKRFVESNRPEMTIWRMRIICLVSKVTVKRSDYVILNASPQKKKMVRRKYLYVLSYILCQSCLCVIVCNWMSPIISEDTPGDTLVVWNSLTSMTTCHAPMVLYWRQKMCSGFYLLCGQRFEYGERMKGAPSAHNAAAVGDIWIFALQSPLRVT